MEPNLTTFFVAAVIDVPIFWLFAEFEAIGVT